MKEFKGAFWPELRKIASPGLQDEFNCDRYVCRFFPAEFICARIPSDIPTTIVSCTAEEWEKLAREWTAEARQQVEPPIQLPMPSGRGWLH